MDSQTPQQEVQAVQTQSQAKGKSTKGLSPLDHPISQSWIRRYCEALREGPDFVKLWRLLNRKGTPSFSSLIDSYIGSKSTDKDKPRSS